VSKIYSNSPQIHDYVQNAYVRMVQSSKTVWIAAPYVTQTDELLQAHKNGKEVKLLVGLNDCTSPKALEQVMGKSGFEIRYFTRRFHAKLYVFDGEALLGSSNLTQGGMTINREATIAIGDETDLLDARRLYSDLWNDAKTLTAETLKQFTKYWTGKRGALDPDPFIESAVELSEPQNSAVNSQKPSSGSLFMESLRRQVSEYQAAFAEIDTVLEDNGLSRPELGKINGAFRTNRFLNWLRLTHAPGEDSWKNVPDYTPEQRRGLIKAYGTEWSQVADKESQIPEDFLEWLERVDSTFGSKDALQVATKDDFSNSLLALHAFHEQLRFTAGGKANLAPIFWELNGNDVEKVRKSFRYLLYGPGEFVVRLVDFISLPELELAKFKKFCALELYGTVKPLEYPPVNGRTAKAMRFLGFKVSGS
jgi:hypothetical protein